MYKLFYDHFKAFYKNRCSLIYTATDSLLMHIETEDIYHDLGKAFKAIMDTNNYPKFHPLQSKENERKLGCLKDETMSRPIKEVCVLKPKMYSYEYGDENKKTAKGIKKSVVENLTHDSYKNVLLKNELLLHSQHQILRSTL